MQPLRERDIEALRALEVRTGVAGWARAEDIGGVRNSHHAATLRKLERHGYARRVYDPTYRHRRYYKVTAAGVRYLGMAAFRPAGEPAHVAE